MYYTQVVGVGPVDLVEDDRVDERGGRERAARAAAHDFARAPTLQALALHVRLARARRPVQVERAVAAAHLRRQSRQLLAR